MREQLLGYLLGALDASEREQLEARLAVDEDLQLELAELRRKLEPLRCDREELQPPLGLAHRTCQYVATHAQFYRMFAASDRWRMQDVLTAAGIIIIVTMLVFPAVYNSRANARLTACGDNLRALGAALLQYSQYHDELFPGVPLEGNRAVAGIYAPQLLEAGFLDRAGRFICPSSPLAADRQFRVPTLAEIDRATSQQLIRLHQTMGGSYAYAMGYVQGGQYHAVRNQARPDFALMADAPGDDLASSPHHGCGFNVLFEDGRVGYRHSCRLDCGDDIFRNRLGQLGPGIGPDDAVVAPSSAAPYIVPALLDR